METAHILEKELNLFEVKIADIFLNIIHCDESNYYDCHFYLSSSIVRKIGTMNGVMNRVIAKTGTQRRRLQFSCSILKREIK